MLVSPDGRVLFTEKELACKETGRIELADGFGDDLLELRLTSGIIMPLTSCCRSALHNRAVGGHPHSLHIWDNNPRWGRIGTCAVDSVMPNAIDRAILIEAALDLGWSVGINFARNFLHFDRRTKYLGLERVLFSY